MTELDHYVKWPDEPDVNSEESGPAYDREEHENWWKQVKKQLVEAPFTQSPYKELQAAGAWQELFRLRRDGAASNYNGHWGPDYAQ